MEESMDNEKNMASKPQATGKTAKRILSLSLATASLLVSASSAFGSITPVSVLQTKPVSGVSASNTARTLPAPLLLKHASSDQQLVAQHSSHASHASHASHSSHASHASGL